MEQIDSSYNVTTASNQGYNGGSALQIRLETNQIIENVEMFLSGSKIEVIQDEEGIRERRVQVGQSKGNASGIQSILNWLQLILNPQVVQGNFPVDRAGYSSMYEDYIYWVRVNFVSDLMENCYKWEVDDSDIEGVVDSIMNIIEPFMTRLIENKERESYEQTVRHIENSRIQDNSKEGIKI